MVKHELGKPYTATEVEELKQNFREFPTFVDDNDGGRILTSDVPALLAAMGYVRSYQEVVFIESYLERKNNGIVTYAEFTEVLKAFHNTAALSLMQANTFDQDGDGYISPDEFEVLMQALIIHNSKLPPTSFEKFFHEADTNRDGKISVQECAEWIAKYTE